MLVRGDGFCLVIESSSASFAKIPLIDPFVFPPSDDLFAFAIDTLNLLLQRTFCRILTKASSEPKIFNKGGATMKDASFDILLLRRVVPLTLFEVKSEPVPYG